MPPRASAARASATPSAAPRREAGRGEGADQALADGAVVVDDEDGGHRHMIKDPLRPEMHLEPGTELGRYAIQALLGEGAMGKVYRAFDPRLRRAVAIKVLSPPAEGAEEADRGRAARGARRGRDPPPERDRRLRRRPRGRGLVHRDGARARRLAAAARRRRLPAPGRARALARRDRGRARRRARRRRGAPRREAGERDGARGRAGEGARLRHRAPAARARCRHADARASGLVGTPAYMAPEQIRGEELDGRADQFGWGGAGVRAARGAAAVGPRRRSGRRARGGALGRSPRPCPPGPSCRRRSPPPCSARWPRRPGDRFPTMGDAVAAIARLRRAPPDRPTRPRRPRLRAPALFPLPGADRAGGGLGRPPGRARAAIRASRGAALREPDFSAPVDLDAHLALLPAGATCKGIFFLDLAPPAAGRAAGGRALPPRRHPRAPLRRVPRLPDGREPAPHRRRRARAASRGCRSARRCAGSGRPRSRRSRRASSAGRSSAPSGATSRAILLHRARAPTGSSSTSARSRRRRPAPGRFLFRARGFPAFLETYQVGVIEGVLRDTDERGRVRIAIAVARPRHGGARAPLAAHRRPFCRGDCASVPAPHGRPPAAAIPRPRAPRRRAAWPRSSSPRAPASRASRSRSPSSASPRPEREEAVHRDVPRRGAPLGAPLALERRPGLRHRRRRQRLLHRDGVRRRRRPQGRSSSTREKSGQRLPGRGRRATSPRRSARASPTPTSSAGSDGEPLHDHPPRHVAAQRAHHQARRGEDRRLRPRQGDEPAREERGRHHQGQVRLPVARGRAGQGGRPARPTSSRSASSSGRCSPAGASSSARPTSPPSRWCRRRRSRRSAGMNPSVPAELDAILGTRPRARSRRRATPRPATSDATSPRSSTASAAR